LLRYARNDELSRITLAGATIAAGVSSRVRRALFRDQGAGEGDALTTLRLPAERRVSRYGILATGTRRFADITFFQGIAHANDHRATLLSHTI
jgi:hypothetical protein